jgi:hypothetical protein
LLREAGRERLARQLNWAALALQMNHRQRRLFRHGCQSSMAHGTASSAHKVRGACGSHRLTSFRRICLREPVLVFDGFLKVSRFGIGRGQRIERLSFFPLRQLTGFGCISHRLLAITDLPIHTGCINPSPLAGEGGCASPPGKGFQPNRVNCLHFLCRHGLW